MNFSRTLSLITVSFIFFGSVAQAASVCSMDSNEFQTRISASGNRLAFKNPLGPMRIGVCWWHSRFQRNANYLFEGVGRQRGAPVNQAQALNIIKTIVGQKSVVQVPAVDGLLDFSTTHAGVISEALGQWQMSDSFLGFGWVRGLKGASGNRPDLMQKEMSTARQKVNQGQIVFQMLQAPGGLAHSWLVYDADQNSAGHSTFTVIDSNFPVSQQQMIYYPNLPHFSMYLGIAIPNTQRENELKTSFETVVRSCGGRSPLAHEMSKVFAR